MSLAMQDTKAAQETKALQDFYSRLSTDSARAFYGSGHVMAAHELQAIQILLISDRLFRTNDVAKVGPSIWFCCANPTALLMLSANHVHCAHLHYVCMYTCMMQACQVRSHRNSTSACIHSGVMNGTAIHLICIV